MDEKRFDDVTRGIGTTRRGTLGWLAGGLGLLVASAPDWADAKKRKRKKKKRKDSFRCTPDGEICPTTTQRDCCNLQCCLGIGEPEGGERYCTSWLHTCCTAEEGGGACPYEFPFCCPTGGCTESEEACIGLHDGASRVDRVR